jgi:hypothetical protein
LSNQLNHFDVDLDKFPDVVQFVCRIIKRDYDARTTRRRDRKRWVYFPGSPKRPGL